MRLISEKFQYTNYYKILISVFIVLWLYAVTKIITYLTNNSNDLLFNIFLASIALCFFLLDDSKLNELYNTTLYKDKAPVPVIMTATN